MLLATTRICARPVAFYNNFDKYSGRERPEVDIFFSNVYSPCICTMCILLL